MLIQFKLKYKVKWLLYGDKKLVKKRYKNIFGKYPNLESPKSLTEKLQWLKLYDRKSIYNIYADKYAVRNVIKEKYGEDILIPLLFKTESWRELNFNNIKCYPCIIKCNDGCGTYKILRSKESVNWKVLQQQFRLWSKCNHYYKSQEWQYKNIKPCYIVEKLLENEKHELPEDYKLHYINGKIQFIHCNIKKNNEIMRGFFDEKWNPVEFSWNKNYKYLNCNKINKPCTLEKMINIGADITKNIPYARVDFYEVSGRLYFGEITICHGSGLNKFLPEKYDTIFEKKLFLPKRI
jgi:hypothetical protein